MPTDPSGQTHAGTIGLFDDATEHDEALARAKRHERSRLEGTIRRQERRDARLDRKDAKAAERASRGKSKLSWAPSWVAKVFGAGEDLSPKAVAARQIAEETERVRVTRRERVEYVIVKRPETPEQVYTSEDIDAVDSPWLAACGMVKVKSDDPGGCHIVPKSSIQQTE